MERLKNLMVFDVLPERRVVFLEDGVSIQEALSILQDKNISGAPVVNTKEGKFLGFVDMFDIVTCLLGVLPLQESDDGAQHFSTTTMAQVIELTSMYQGFPISCWPVKREMFLPKVMELFWTGVHRVPVLSADNNIINVLTQSDVLTFMAQNMHLLEPSSRKKTLAQCNLGGVPPLTARETDKTSTVVKLLHDKRITALPVLNEEGQVTANFSISDLKGLNGKNFKDIFLPVKSYLEKRASSSDASFHCERSLHPLTVNIEDGLEETIYKMVATRVHR